MEEDLGGAIIAMKTKDQRENISLLVYQNMGALLYPLFVHGQSEPRPQPHLRRVETGNQNHGTE